MFQCFVFRGQQRAQKNLGVKFSQNTVNTSEDFVEMLHRTLSDSSRLNILFCNRELAHSQNLSTYQPQRLIKQPEDVTVSEFHNNKYCQKCEVKKDKVKT